MLLPLSIYYSHNIVEYVKELNMILKRVVSIVLLLLSSLSSIHAQWCNTNYCSPSVLKALICKALDIRIHGGIQPIVWYDRGGIFGENEIMPVVPPGQIGIFGEPITQDNQTEIIQGQCIPKFNTIFATPWMIGAQIGYTWNDCLRLFIEGNYVQARTKSPEVKRLPVLASTGAPAGTTLNFIFDNMRLFDGYFGVYYYWSRWCNRASLFVGAKIGFVHHGVSYFSLTETIPIDNAILTLDLVPVCPKREFLIGDTSVAGGIALGVDICICSCWNFILSGEIVANRGPKTNCNIPVSIEGIPTKRLFFGPIKRELRFPFVIGIRYTF